MIAKEKWTAKYVEYLQNLAKGCISLESTVRADNGDEVELGITIPSDEPSPEEVLIKKELVGQVIEAMYKILEPREIAVMRYRFGLDGGDTRTLQEVGKKYGLTRERVRQIERNAIIKLRKHLKEHLGDVEW